MSDCESSDSFDSDRFCRGCQHEFARCKCVPCPRERRMSCEGCEQCCVCEENDPDEEKCLFCRPESDNEDREVVSDELFIEGFKARNQAVKSPQKAKKPKPTKPRIHIQTKPTYPVMVQQSILALNDRKGSSRQAIKSYMKTEFALREVNTSTFNKSLKKLIEEGTISKMETGQKWKIKKIPLKKINKSPKTTMAKKIAAKKALKKTTKKTIS